MTRLRDPETPYRYDGALIYDDSCRHGWPRRFVGRFIRPLHRHPFAYFGGDDGLDMTVSWDTQGIVTMTDPERRA